MQQDEIRRSVRIGARRDTVWRLVSEPGWWINDGALEQHAITTTTQPDGTVVADVAGNRHGTWRIVVVELREPDFAAFRWAPHGGDRDATGPLGSTLIEFRLSGADGEVVVDVVESGFASLPVSPEDAAANYRDNAEGWTEELRALAAAAQT